MRHGFPAIHSISSGVLCLLILSALQAGAQVKLASIFGNHMVLQRDVPIPVWGRAAPGEQVTVSLGQATAQVTAQATADASGNWEVKLPARPATETPLDLRVSGKTTIAVHDVVVGEVWIAAGQSNMDWAFFWGDGVLNTKEEMAAADYPLIRDCKVTTSTSPVAKSDMHASWSVCTPKLPGSHAFSSGIERFTATGYFFARELHRRLHVPIGLINSSYGGTEIEAWLDPDTARQFPLIDHRWQEKVAGYPARKAAYDAALAAHAAAIDAGQTAGKGAPQAPTPPEKDISQPSGLYNAMIHPFLGYAFKGVIWYQGENNVKHAAEYRELFPALIRGWRRQLGEGDFPFYWAQLSNYDYQSRPNGTEWAFLREAQTMTLAVPNTGQAITIDIGDARNIHLRNKQEVGRRLALLALARTYGCKTVVDSGPVFDRADLSANPVKIYFRNADGGLQRLAPDPKIPPSAPALAAPWLGGFEVAGADRIFHGAQARIDETGAFISLSCADVPSPMAIRYAWRNDPKNLLLGNSAGLPAAPFRTDTWPEDPAEIGK